MSRKAGQFSPTTKAILEYREQNPAASMAAIARALEVPSSTVRAVVRRHGKLKGIMTITEVNENIDRLLHDAEHAVSGAVFAASIGHVTPASEMHQKARRLKAEADKLFLDNPGSFWPECEWPAPKAME